MIADTSVLIAILRGEPEAVDFSITLEANRPVLMSAGSWIEVAVVLSRLGAPGLEARSIDLVETLGFRIEPVTIEQAEIARAAYREFGKGNHSARLNFGDCFAYALSKATGEPLLFKGDDFARTDVVAA
jgi:ribonuclease VapC